MNKKEELRNHYKKQRKKLSLEHIQLYSSAICDVFLKNFIDKGQVFHVFKSIKNLHEIDTSTIIQELLSQNKKVILPKINGDNLLACQIKKNQTYELNSFGVEEPKSCHEINPKEIDIAIIPMLICDEHGHRIGYGGGFYDRFLKDLNITKVGINFFKPLENISLKEEHDIPLDYLITPNLFLKF